jgi:hypothetical protein
MAWRLWRADSDIERAQHCLPRYKPFQPFAGVGYHRGYLNPKLRWLVLQPAALLSLHVCSCDGASRGLHPTRAKRQHSCACSFRGVHAAAGGVLQMVVTLDRITLQRGINGQAN